MNFVGVFIWSAFASSRLSMERMTPKSPLDPIETVMRSAKVKTKLRGFSPQASYTDRAAAACRLS
jgi:hypothetical protein